jgi:hypothetical protein
MEDSKMRLTTSTVVEVRKVKIETSGADPIIEQSVRDVALLLIDRNLTDQEEKANFIIKELESRHGQSWACFVEPLKNFVQCMGVSKRPD